MMNLKDMEYDYMNLNRLFFLLLAVFVLTAGTSIIFAEEVSVSDISFDVPGNYSINNTTDDSCLLINDNHNNYTINIIKIESSDALLEKNSRITSGFNFLADDNYTAENNLTVNKQDFTKNESFFSFYSFDVDNSSYMIIYTFPIVDELESSNFNPVNEIIDSVH